MLKHTASKRQARVQQVDKPLLNPVPSRPIPSHGDVPLLRNGAAAPSRERGAAKAAAVIAYLEAALAANLPVDRTARGMVARDTGSLLDEGWELPAILRAIARFAGKRRMRGHLAQWVREKAGDERVAEHEARKATDRRASEETMRSLAVALRDAGL